MDKVSAGGENKNTISGAKSLNIIIKSFVDLCQQPVEYVHKAQRGTTDRRRE